MWRCSRFTRFLTSFISLNVNRSDSIRIDLWNSYIYLLDILEQLVDNGLRHFFREYLDSWWTGNMCFEMEFPWSKYYTLFLLPLVIFESFFSLQVRMLWMDLSCKSKMIDSSKLDSNVSEYRHGNLTYRVDFNSAILFSLTFANNSMRFVSKLLIEYVHTRIT